MAGWYRIFSWTVRREERERLTEDMRMRGGTGGWPGTRGGDLRSANVSNRSRERASRERDRRGEEEDFSDVLIPFASDQLASQQVSFVIWLPHIRPSAPA